MRSRPHDDAMAELFRDDPALALEVINGILADGNQAELMAGLRQLAQDDGPAFGGAAAYFPTVRAHGLSLASMALGYDAIVGSSAQGYSPVS